MRELNCFNQVRRHVPCGASTTPIRLTQNCTPTTPSVNSVCLYTHAIPPVAPRCATFISSKDDRTVDIPGPRNHKFWPEFSQLFAFSFMQCFALLAEEDQGFSLSNVLFNQHTRWRKSGIILLIMNVVVLSRGAHLYSPTP